MRSALALPLAAALLWASLASAWAVSSAPATPAAGTAQATAAPSPSPTAASTLQPSPQPSATPTPTPTPTSATSPGPTASPTALPSTGATAPALPAVGTTLASRQPLINDVRQRLSPDVADILATQSRLAESLAENERGQRDLEARILASQKHLDALDTEIRGLDAEIESTAARIGRGRIQLRAVARALYMRPDALLLQVVQAGGVREAVTSTGDLVSVAGRTESLERQLAADRERLQGTRAESQRARDEESRVLYERSGVVDELRNLVQQEQDTRDRLDTVLGKTRAALAAVGGEWTSLGLAVAEQIRADWEALNAEAMREAWMQVSIWARLNHAPAPDQPSAGSVSQYAAADPGGHRFVWPERGASITQGYGPTDLWFEPSYGGFPHFHTGLDLVAADTRIFAAGSGVVAAVGHGHTGYGNYIVISHADAYSTLYGHLSVTGVGVGDSVAQGQQIGIEGSTGMSTGPHLHFEVRLNGEPRDPSPFLAGSSGG